MPRVLLVAVLLLTGRESGASAPPNVVVVVVDTLRADKLGAYGNERGLTPFLDGLAARGTTFEHAYAASSWTVPSIASLFTSRYPSQHRVVTYGQRLRDDEVTLAKRLRQAGWVGGGYSANPLLQATSYGSGFADWYPTTYDKGELDGDALRALALGWLDAERRSQPLLLYVQYMEPHAPYAPREPFRSRFAVDEAGHVVDPTGAPWRMLKRATARMLSAECRDPSDPGMSPVGLSTSDIRFTRADALPLERLYDAEVASADDQVRRLFDELARRGLLRNALVVVTADHGEEFCDHGLGGHGTTLYEESVRVPLIVVGPGVPAGRRVTGNVSLVDVAPTLLALLGLPAEPRFEGRSLVPAMRGSSPRDGTGPAVLLQLERWLPEAKDGRTHARGLVDGRWKLLVGRDQTRSVYDLAADPGETHADPARAPHGDALSAALADADRRLATTAAPSAAPGPIDKKLKQQLRALGYVH